MSNPLEPIIRKMQQEIDAMQPQLISTLGDVALKFVDDNFSKQGYQGSSFQPWPQLRKKPKGARRSILVNTGKLRRSPKKSTTATGARISTDIVYAQIHNEGGEIKHASREVILNYREKKGGKLKLSKVRSESQQRSIGQIRRASTGDHTVKMPRRQFFPTDDNPSPVLEKAAEKAIIQKIYPILKSIT